MVRWIVLAAGVFALAAATASAEDEPGTVSSIPSSRAAPQLTVTGSQGDDSVTVDLDDTESEYLVFDAIGLVPGPNCVSIDPQRVRCVRLAEPDLNDRFVARLRGGDDSFRMLAAARSGWFEGGRGDDSITGSAAPSDLLGDEGDDELRGRAGPDRLYGDKGHDSLRGGAGDDRLDAHNSDRDRLINCGRGDDVALIDRRLDPKPVGCERIRRFPGR